MDILKRLEISDHEHERMGFWQSCEMRREIARLRAALSMIAESGSDYERGGLQRIASDALDLTPNAESSRPREGSTEQAPAAPRSAGTPG